MSTFCKTHIVILWQRPRRFSKSSLQKYEYYTFFSRQDIMAIYIFFNVILVSLLLLKKCNLQFFTILPNGAKAFLNSYTCFQLNALNLCSKYLNNSFTLVQIMPSLLHHSIFLGVVLRDGDVVVGDFGRVRSRFLLSVPHDVVQVREVVIQVDPLEAVSSLRPAGQFRALQQIQVHRSQVVNMSDTQWSGTAASAPLVPFNSIKFKFANQIAHFSWMSIPGKYS